MNLRLPNILLPAKDVIIFLFLLFSFHFLYLFWSKTIGFFPLAGAVEWLFRVTSETLLAQSIQILQLVGVDVAVHELTLYSGHAYVTVAPECTTLKQWLHWIVIMAFFPGPALHKLWFIPVGLVAIHLTNLLRITGLLVLQFPFPEMFHFFHDFVFKPLFYAVIFGMWVLWNEKIRKSGTSKV